MKTKHLESLFLSIGIFSFFMAIMCIPVSLYNNPFGSQSLFNLVKFQPMFKYLFIGFVVAGYIFMVIPGHLYFRRKDILSDGPISPEERVRMVNEKKDFDLRIGE